MEQKYQTDLSVRIGKGKVKIVRTLDVYLELHRLDDAEAFDLIGSIVYYII